MKLNLLTLFKVTVCAGTILFSGCKTDEVVDVNEPPKLTKADEIVNSKEFEDYERLCQEFFQEFSEVYGSLSDVDKEMLKNKTRSLQQTRSVEEQERLILQIYDMCGMNAYVKLMKLNNKRAEISNLFENTNEKELLTALKRREQDQILHRGRTRESFKQLLGYWDCTSMCRLKVSIAVAAGVYTGGLAGAATIILTGMDHSECIQKCKRRYNIN